MGHSHKTLAVTLVLCLLASGIPLFFTGEAEAATAVIVKEDDWKGSALNSNGWLRVTVMKFPRDVTVSELSGKAGDPIAGYPIDLVWDRCIKQLNPLDGWWKTLRDSRSEPLITDHNGEAKFDFKLGNGVWTENAWIRGASGGWQDIEYYLGNMASRSLHLYIYVQASGESDYLNARGDTLGIIQDWYDMVEYPHSTTYTGDVAVYGSKSYAGATKIIVESLATATGVNGVDGEPVGAGSATASVGTISGYELYGSTTPFMHSLTSSGQGSFTDARVKTIFGDGASFSGPSTSSLQVSSTSAASPNVWTISNITTYGPSMTLYWGGAGSDYRINYQIYVGGVLKYPTSGGWETGTAASGESKQVTVELPYRFGTTSTTDIQIRAYLLTGSTTGAFMEIIFPTRTELVLTNLQESMTSTVLSTNSDFTLSVDLTGHWGQWQISGWSSTLTREDLVPVNARIQSIYPLVVSNPRFDKTPVSGGATNGLKFDVYNLVGQETSATIYLSLLADNTTVWSSTVGQQSYPAWVNQSQFVSVHLTNVAFPADPRREYSLRITSGGAITEIPVVFYPPELDPDLIYEPKDDLDDIIDSFRSVNAAALQAYYSWAVGMEPRVTAIQGDVANYSKLFDDRQAMDQLAQAKAAAERAMELIGDLKEICKGDAAGTNIGELKLLGEGIWSNYLAALLHRETAVSYEAGQDAFGNSTALDAWYANLDGQRIYVGLQDKTVYDDTDNPIVWIALAVALVAGGIVSFLFWSNLSKYIPRGRTKTLRRVALIAPIIIALVAGILVAVGAYFLTIQVAMAISNAIDGLGLALFPGW